MHIRIDRSPRANAFNPVVMDLGDIYGDRVEVETDCCIVPRGIWVRICPEFIVAEQMKLKWVQDDEKRKWISAMIKLAQHLTFGDL